jgi:hypothetical protein
MATSERKNAVLHCADVPLSYESVQVTVTATMGNGSLLLADNTEGAAADAATVVSIIDDPKFDEGFYAVGDTILVPVGKRNLIASSDVIKFSDAAYGAETLTALVAAGVKLQSSTVDFSRLQ